MIDEFTSVLSIRFYIQYFGGLNFVLFMFNECNDIIFCHIMHVIIQQMYVIIMNWVCWILSLSIMNMGNWKYGNNLATTLMISGLVAVVQSQSSLLSTEIIEHIVWVSLPTAQTQYCKLDFKMGSKLATVELQCINSTTPYTITYSVIESIEDQKCDTHIFKLFDSTDNNTANVNVTAASTGTEWSFQFQFQNNRTGRVTISGKFIQGQFLAGYIMSIYSALSLIILPPYLPYYWNMIGYNLLTSIASHLLTISIFISSFLTLYKYTQQLFTSGQSTMVIVLLFLSCAVVAVQFVMKTKILVRKVYIKYGSNRSRGIVLGLVWGVLALAVWLFVRIHKDVTTYIGFASALIYYMSSFMILKQMRKVYFSYRGVLIDSLGIVLLSILSRVYPLMHYQIATYYNLIASLLIFTILQLYSFTIYILINVIKKDSNRHNQSHMISLDSHQFEIKNQQKQLRQERQETSQRLNKKMKLESEFNSEEEKEKQKSVDDGKWKRLKQQSMISQIVNVNVSGVVSRGEEDIKETGNIE